MTCDKAEAIRFKKKNHWLWPFCETTLPMQVTVFPYKICAEQVRAGVEGPFELRKKKKKRQGTECKRYNVIEYR